MSVCGFTIYVCKNDTIDVRNLINHSRILTSFATLIPNSIDPVAVSCFFEKQFKVRVRKTCASFI